MVPLPLASSFVQHGNTKLWDKTKILRKKDSTSKDTEIIQIDFAAWMWRECPPLLLFEDT